MTSLVVTGKIGVKRTPFKSWLASQLAVFLPDRFFIGTFGGVLVEKHHIGKTLQKLIRSVNNAPSAAVEDKSIGVNSLNQPFFSIKLADGIILFGKSGISPSKPQVSTYKSF